MIAAKSQGDLRAPGYLAIGVHVTDPPQCHRLARCLGRAAAEGFLTDAEIRVCLTLEAVRRVPGHPALEHVIGRSIWTARDAEAAHLAALGRSERRIRRAVWELCRARRPGAEVMRAALAASDPALDRHQVAAICRTVAQQTQRIRGANRAELRRRHAHR